MSVSACVHMSVGVSMHMAMCVGGKKQADTRGVGKGQLKSELTTLSPRFISIWAFCVAFYHFNCSDVAFLGPMLNTDDS